MIRERALLLRYAYIACLLVTQMECLYCAVRAEFLNIIYVSLSLYK